MSPLDASGRRPPTNYTHNVMKPLQISCPPVTVALSVALTVSLVVHAYSIFILLSPHARSIRDSKLEFPIPLRPVAMTFENTHRYGLKDDEDWASLTPPGFGFIQLPGRNDFFSISLYHQVHCLNNLRKMINRRGNLTHGIEVHAEHCLTYLRQSILCHADVTLEETKPERTPEGKLVDAAMGFDATHRCQDWTQVREYMAQNYDGWRDKAD